MKIGFGKMDITPRVGVQLCGFGPFLNRVSTEVRDRLWAKAVAFDDGKSQAVIVSCDLIGVDHIMTRRVREIAQQEGGLDPQTLMVHCTHTHSGPGCASYSGWGEQDAPYMEILPFRLARAAIAAVRDLREGKLSHAQVPCEGMGLNREYDKDAPPLAEVLREDWRPAKPELTDTTCQVFRIDREGKLAGFLSYFGCHPVVCCQTTTHIHGDYCGVASNMLEREFLNSTGLFLQGAQGDVNSCVVHKPQPEALLALDIIAARYARAVRQGLAEAKPIADPKIAHARRLVTFTRKQVSLESLRERLAKHEAAFAKPEASDEDSGLRMDAVYAVALRKTLIRLENGDNLSEPVELQGVRIGPVAFLGSPFEIMQAIKNEVVTQARAPIPLVMGITNGSLGYAPDHTAAARGGYAQDVVPFIVGTMPFANIHDELRDALLALDRDLDK